MWSGFTFGVPAFFITAFTNLLGGILLVSAWVKFTSERSPDGKRSVPAALNMFTAAVFLDWIGIIFFLLAPEGLQEIVWSLFLVSSFAFVIACVALVRRGSWPGRRIVQVGSVSLLVVNVLGFIVFLIG